MVEAGILAPDERVELIEGQLYRMAAKGTFHSAAITRIKRLLEARLGNRVLLRFQDPVRLSDALLPKLLSGEIRIKETEKVVKAVA
jgi:hypothetical protein